MSLVLIPISIKDAKRALRRWHRHHAHDPSKALFAVAVAEMGEEEPCGVAIIGPPVARMLENGWTAEVVRVATDGTHNACSKLYGAAWRAARALGYKRLITYTLAEEGGASLRAAGYTLVGEAGGGSWSRTNRPRFDKHPMQTKIRWERSAAPADAGEGTDG